MGKREEMNKIPKIFRGPKFFYAFLVFEIMILLGMWVYLFL